jgi:hypothetical protein
VNNVVAFFCPSNNLIIFFFHNNNITNRTTNGILIASKNNVIMAKVYQISLAQFLLGYDNKNRSWHSVIAFIICPSMIFFVEYAGNFK